MVLLNALLMTDAELNALWDDQNDCLDEEAAEEWRRYAQSRSGALPPGTPPAERPRRRRRKS
jgi:hypothetical protein